MSKELIVGYIEPRKFMIDYHKDTVRISELTPSMGGGLGCVQEITLDTLVHQLEHNRGINPETGLEGQIIKKTGYYTIGCINDLVDKDTLQPIEYMESFSSDPSFKNGTIVESEINHGFKSCKPSELLELILKVKSRFNVHQPIQEKNPDILLDEVTYNKQHQAPYRLIIEKSTDIDDGEPTTAVTYRKKERRKLGDGFELSVNPLGLIERAFFYRPDESCTVMTSVPQLEYELTDYEEERRYIFERLKTLGVLTAPKNINQG